MSAEFSLRPTPAREAINRQMRNVQLAFAAGIPLVAFLGFVLLNEREQYLIVWFIGLGLPIVIPKLFPVCCPQCSGDVASLRNEGGFRLKPELDHKITTCPYCGANFGWIESEVAERRDDSSLPPS